MQHQQQHWDVPVLPMPSLAHPLGCPGSAHALTCAPIGMSRFYPCPHLRTHALTCAPSLAHPAAQARGSKARADVPACLQVLVLALEWPVSLTSHQVNRMRVMEASRAANPLVLYRCTLASALEDAGVCLAASHDHTPMCRETQLTRLCAFRFHLHHLHVVWSLTVYHLHVVWSLSMHHLDMVPHCTICMWCGPSLCPAWGSQGRGF